jgi:hypothetical protein
MVTLRYLQQPLVVLLLVPMVILSLNQFWLVVVVQEARHP